MHITYSAPAKIILSGEHSVVYGKPALVSAVNMRLEFSITDDEGEMDSALQSLVSTIQSVVTNYLQKEGITFSEKQFSVHVNSHIPVGRGMGSSAALSVAGVAAFLEFYTGKEYDKSIINSLAYQCEKKFHANPSGVDNSASCFGGLIYFRKEFEFLKNISSLNFKIPQNIQEKLFLIDTGKPKETTADMVKLVGKEYNSDPKQTDSLLQSIEKITKRMVVSIVKEDAKMFENCVVENEKCLEELGIVSTTTHKLIESLQPFGVGKVTGAGGITGDSGFVLFYSEDAPGLNAHLKEEKISIYKFEQDFEGVRASNALNSFCQ